MSKVSFAIESARLERHIQLEQGKAIAGRVIDSAGIPVGGVNIVAGNECLSTTQTKEDGTFTVHGLGDGTATLRAHKWDYVWAEAKADPGATDVCIQLGHATLEILIESETPPSDFSFTLRTLGISENPCLSMDTDYGRPTSRIEFRGLKSGTYELEISARGYQTDDRPVFDVTPTSTVHTVHLRFRPATPPA